MKSLTFILALLAGTLLFEKVEAQAVKDPKAQEILKGVSSKYKGLQSISANFTITTLDQKSNVTDKQSGTLLVKGKKYHLTLKGQEVISDGKTSWTYLKESNEVQVNEVSESDALSPANIFTIYEKGFSSKYTGEKKVGNVTMQQVELVPDDQKKTYFKVQISINKQDKLLSSAKIFDKNGTVYTYQIDKLKMDAPAPDASFTFESSKYPGVEVVDLR